MNQRFGRTDDELAALPLPYAPGLFDGQTVLISGAGSGIGRAAAHAFARLGAKLVLCGRNADKLADVDAALTRYDCERLIHPLSIRDADAVAGLFDAADDRFGGIDILVNNAGGQFPQAAIDYSVKGWNAVIDTNLNGSWYMMQTAARRWRDAGRPGVVVNVVAQVSRGMPGVAHTCAARAGVIYLSKTVAVEWAPLGIRINCVAPGVISTEGMNVYPEEARAHFPDANAMRRMGEVEDAVNAICFLAGPTSKFMTGEVVTVDGGHQLWGDQWTIPRPAYFDPSGER